MEVGNGRRICTENSPERESENGVSIQPMIYVLPFGKERVTTSFHINFNKLVAIFAQH